MATAAGMPAVLEPKTPKKTQLELDELDKPRICTLAETLKGLLTELGAIFAA
jgi:hypothetical protein